MSKKKNSACMLVDDIDKKIKLEKHKTSFFDWACRYADLPKRVYISGAISGRNKGATAHKFAQAERYITALGFVPVNPLKNGLPATATWEQHMKKDIALLGTCSRVLMLSDWEESKGARQELKEAIKQNKKITFL